MASVVRLAASVDVAGLVIGDVLVVNVEVMGNFGLAAALVRAAVVAGADLIREVADVVVAGLGGAFAAAVLAVDGLLTVLNEKKKFEYLPYFVSTYNQQW